MYDLKKVEKIIIPAKSLARKYRELTGKPLGIAGEVAEFTAAKHLGVKLEKARTEGYDGTWRKKKVQIKGRCLQKGKPPGALGTIQLKKDWESVLLVLLEEDLEPRAIYEMRKGTIKKAMEKSGSKVRNRGALTVNFFKREGTRVWSKV